MRKIIFLFLFAIVFSFCKNKKAKNSTTVTETETNSTETNKPEEVKTISFSQDSLGLKSELCNNDEEGACAEVKVNFLKASGAPTEAVEKINLSLNNIILSILLPGDKDSTKKITISEAATSYIKNYEQMIAEEEDKSFIPQFSNETDSRILFDSPDIVCISVSNYDYSGGAHGNYFTTLLNFDKKTGTQIKVADILKDKNQLSPFLEKLAKEHYEVEEGQTLKDIGMYYEGDNFPVNDNIGILQDSLIFEYNPYEVGPYVMGNMSLKIAKSEIKDLLK